MFSAEVERGVFNRPRVRGELITFPDWLSKKGILVLSCSLSIYLQSWAHCSAVTIAVAGARPSDYSSGNCTVGSSVEPYLVGGLLVAPTQQGPLFTFLNPYFPRLSDSPGEDMG